MNCKRDQLAWIVVPKNFHGSGLEQLNGHVVKTVERDPAETLPSWIVRPRQQVRFLAHVIDRSGQKIQAGDIGWTDSIPDAFLRPFDPNSEPLNEPAARNLERTA